MTRRAVLIAAAPQLLRSQPDQWHELADVWNPFAEKLNQGVLDLKMWKRVVRQVERIEGKSCPANK